MAETQDMGAAILVIDDDALLVQLLEKAFDRFGYQVTAVDLVPEPLDHLRRKAQERHLEIEILHQDAFQMQQAYNQTFDVFLEQTFFSAIDPSLYGRYEPLVHRALKPGGQLLGVFMEIPWEGGPPHNSPPDLVLSLFPGARWVSGGTKPWAPQNPSRPGPEYTLQLVKRATPISDSEPPG